MRKRIVVVGFGLCISLSSCLLATTWYVDGSASEFGDGSSWEKPLQTIQLGIDMASDLDTIIVSEGTYVENIRFKGKNILLTGTDPLAPDVVARTIIDGNKGGSVLTFSGNENETCVLSGFTIRNGRAASSGGGICGGTSSNHTQATIRNNVITGNSAPATSPVGSGEGGGLAWCDGPIENNVVGSNSAYWSGGGLSNCDGNIENNLIFLNSGGHLYEGSGYDGGGGLSACDGVVQNNTIVGNSALGSGGGLYYCGGTIRNCIIWANTATSTYPDKQLRDSSSPVSSCIQDWWAEGGENISDDPLFVDAAAGDYHLQELSPCIDVGQGFYWFAWPQRDLDGNCRLIGDGIEMGCYEHASSRDSDGDLLSDSDEVIRKTDPLNDNTDGDGLRDGLEILRGSDPLQTTQSGIIRVPEDAPTIQQCFCLALASDEIVVGPGTHLENIRFPGVDITLRSSDPHDLDVVESTILDGHGVGPVVSFTGDESESCVLTGFTICGGQTYCGAGICGGTEGKHTHATIENNIISRNDADYGGGLAFCDGVIRGNTISENSARQWGAGLYECSGRIQSNVISDNAANYHGGGLLFCHGTLKANIVSGNSAGERGGGIFSCAGVIENNAFVANWAGLDGGGLHTCAGIIQNNTIYGNSAQCGGGLWRCNAVIRNCIIWGNTASESSQIYEGTPPSFSCIEDWSGGGNGNIGLDPLFADIWVDDYRLVSSSPCIDAGANYYWSEWPQRDAGGNCRLVGERIDMGCYEYGASQDTDGDLLSDVDEATAGTDALKDDSDADGLRDGLELLRGTDPLQKTAPAVIHIPDEFPTIQPSLCLAMSGEEIIVEPGIYSENLLFCGADVILRSSNPHDSDVVASTILDGSAMGTVVSFSGHETEKCLLKGFTIRNGNGVAGGGVCGGTAYHHTHATIENNAVSNNTAIVGGGVAWCDGLVRCNIISANSANQGGGLSQCGATIQNNTITINSAVDVYGGGSGLRSCIGTIRNCIVWGNSAPTNSQLAKSSLPTYSCIQDWALGGEGNIALDPRFVNPGSGDPHLLPGSPCIDAGTTTGSPDCDIDGEIRPHGTAVDIGADECVDTDSDGMPDYWELKYLGGFSYDGTDDTDSDGLTDVQECGFGTDPTNADMDGDGFSDGDEFVAGTCPTDAQSLFQVTVLAYDCEAGAQLQWTVVPGKRYQVYIGTELPAWARLGKPYLASAGQSLMTFTDGTACGFQRRFYKVQVFP